MAISHAAAILVNQLLHGDASRRQFNAWVFDPATDAKAAQAFAPVAAKAAEPLWAFFNDVAHPVQGFKIVRQRGFAKQTDLGNVGRAHPGLAAFSFNAFNHGGFFTADVGTCAAPQFNQRQFAGWLGLQLG